MKHRSNVDPHLFPDALPCLQHLTSKYKLAIMTNGNADLKNSIMMPYLVDTLTASETAAAKPSPMALLPLVLRNNVHPSRALYIGDNYENDVLGANAVGMHTALLNRKGNWKGNGFDVQPNIMLSSLSLDEVTSKLDDYVRSLS